MTQDQLRAEAARDIKAYVSENPPDELYNGTFDIVVAADILADAYLAPPGPRPDVETLAKELRAAWFAPDPVPPALFDFAAGCWVAVARRAIELLPPAASETTS